MTREQILDRIRIVKEELAEERLSLWRYYNGVTIGHDGLEAKTCNKIIREILDLEEELSELKVQLAEANRIFFGGFNEGARMGK